jgi:hypothetical protein
MNNADKFFLEQIQIFCEADMAMSQYRIKRGEIGGMSSTNMARRGQIAVSSAEDQASKDAVFTARVKASESGKRINIARLLSELPKYKGKPELVKKDILKLTRTKLTDKTAFNPFPEDPTIGDFVVPFFRLPDLLLAINSLIAVEDSRDGKQLLAALKNKVGEIYHTITGADPANVSELNAIRSFKTTMVQRKYKGDEKQFVYQQAPFGGKSARDDWEHTFITNTKELEGPNFERLRKYEILKGLLFTGEERSNPDEHDSDTYTPERKTPENLAGETLANPDREKLATSSEPAAKKPKPAKPAAKPKPAAKKAPAKKAPAKKAPAKKAPAKKTVEKESYFIKVVAF